MMADSSLDRKFSMMMCSAEILADFSRMANLTNLSQMEVQPGS